MRPTLHRSITAVWLLLILAALVSWLLSTSFALGGRISQTQESVSIILIAFFKVRLVIRYFMDVRTAPRELRLACDVWVIGVCAVILALYTLNPH